MRLVYKGFSVPPIEAHHAGSRSITPPHVRATHYLRASVAAFAEYPGHYNTLISCCGHLGLVDEAKEVVAVRNRIGPPLRLSVLRENLARFAHRDVFVEGLRKAGVPE
jgi:adenylate cyclase